MLGKVREGGKEGVRDKRRGRKRRRTEGGKRE